VRVVIDDDVCSGHGRCYVMSPTLFTDDDRGYGQVIGDGTLVDGDSRAAAERAVGGCPEHAISIVDD
jgi:ferredoxin